MTVTCAWAWSSTLRFNDPTCDEESNIHYDLLIKTPSGNMYIYIESARYTMSCGVLQSALSNQNYSWKYAFGDSPFGNGTVCGDSMGRYSYHNDTGVLDYYAHRDSVHIKLVITDEIRYIIHVTLAELYADMLQRLSLRAIALERTEDNILVVKCPGYRWSCRITSKLLKSIRKCISSQTALTLESFDEPGRLQKLEFDPERQRYRSVSKSYKMAIPCAIPSLGTSPTKSLPIPCVIVPLGRSTSLYRLPIPHTMLAPILEYLDHSGV